MTAMTSPDGDEFDIHPEGVEALQHLGWETVEPVKAPDTPAKPAQGEAKSKR